MTAILDQFLTFAIVLAAAVYVIWKIFLPVQTKTRLRYLARGSKAPCEPVTPEGGCAVGCAGCSLAAVRAAPVTGARKAAGPRGARR
ncbi:MAG: hypothetical protein H6888_06260 [Nitratireductor sp.]|nr:hypothetical protein [Nitratireductor sp.]MCC0020664.1 hypothetical protein [Nitratireductor sp.]